MSIERCARGTGIAFCQTCRLAAGLGIFVLFGKGLNDADPDPEADPVGKASVDLIWLPIFFFGWTMLLGNLLIGWEVMGLFCMGDPHLVADPGGREIGNRLI